MQLQHFFDSNTNTLTYLIWDEHSKEAIIIDPVLDYDPQSSTASTTSLEKLYHFIIEAHLNPLLCLETHVHADHLTGSSLLKNKFPTLKVCISDKIGLVQKRFREIYNFDQTFNTNGEQFDYLIKENDVLNLKGLEVKPIFTPGHTPACVTYLINNHWAFTGDALFMPDFGTGRCDFPDGSAEILFESISKKIYSLPNHIILFTGHDYMPGGRPLAFSSSVEEQKEKNIHIKQNTLKEDFIKFRQTRDSQLPTPKLLFPSIQFNMNGGKPAQEENGKFFLKIPFVQSKIGF